MGIKGRHTMKKKELMAAIREGRKEEEDQADQKGCSSSRVDAVRCTDNKDWYFLSWLTVAFFKYFSQSGQIDEREGPNCATHDDRDDDHF